MTYQPLRALVDAARQEITDFCQRALRIPSLARQEGPLAQMVLEEMRMLGYDEAHIDAAGNVIGRLGGAGGHTVLLHAHMDIVDPGDATRWQHPPFAGDLAEGYLWGRGASDDKGSMAAQVYALGLLKRAGLRPAGDAYVAAVVAEETGGLGTRYLARSLRPDLAIIGEPSGNTLRRGHRGRFEFVITWHGRSAHASAPQRGLNPHFSAARFLLALREAPMGRDADFPSNVTPTLSYVDQTSANVIPAQLTVHLDWRNHPHETLAEAKALLSRLLDETTEPGIRYTVALRGHTVRTYTGLEETVYHDIGPFLMEPDDPRLSAAHRILEETLERPVKTDLWAFTTDGGTLFAQGVPCLGFGPGEESMAHVLDERLAVDELIEATAAYMGLALQLGRADTW